MEPAKRVAINTGILYTRMGITVFISLYTTRLILEALGAEDFGLFNLVGGTIAMLGFLNASMAAASQRFMSFARGAGGVERLKQIFNVSIVLHLIIAGLLFIILEVAGYFFFNGILTISAERIQAAKLIYQFVIISTLFTVVSVPYDAVINAHENMLLLAALGLLESLLKLLIALYISYTTYDQLIVYGLLMAGLSVLLLIIRRIYCDKKYNECQINIRKYFNQSVFKEMRTFAGWSLIGSSSSMLSNYGQGIVMNMFFGTIVNASQGIANQVSGQLGVFSVTLLKALNPLIAKSEGAGDRSLVLKASVMGSKISFFMLMFFCIPVLVEMSYILKIWLKEVPEYAVVFCRLLLIRNLIQQFCVTLNSTIAAEGNIRKYQLYTSILTSLTLPVSYAFFMLKYPAYSIYVVFIIYQLIVSGFVIYFANKNCELSIQAFLVNVVFKCMFLFALVIGISFVPVLIMQESTARFLLISALSTASFFILVWQLGLSLDERKGIKHIVYSGLEKLAIKTPKLSKKTY
jgi:O-antigen/teichoic acid export membrane protein